MGKVLLIIGAVLGGLILLFGLLALLVGLSDTGPDRSDEIEGSILFLGIGAAIVTPCVFALVLTRLRSATRLPAWTSAVPPAAPAGNLSVVGLSVPAGSQVVTAPDLARSYMEWFGWCAREVGADPVVLHAATMAALRKAVDGDPSAAAEAAHTVARKMSGPVPAQPHRTIGKAKLRQLSRLAAGTLPVLEPGEQVQVSVYGQNRRTTTRWHVLLGVIGFLIAATQSGAYFLTITDRRLIVLTGSQFDSRPKALAFAITRSLVADARWRRGILGLPGVFRVKRLDGGWTVAAVPRSWKREAEAAYGLLAPTAGSTPLPATPFP
jgi:hypothetical protein